MYIVMLGGPGSGKGSASKILTNQLNIPHISTGDMFREQIRKQTELGKIADSYISKGQLVPDEITIQVVKDRLNWKDAKNGVVLDGFPRTERQAKALDQMLKEQGKKVDLAPELRIPDEIIIQRVVNRVMCSNKKCGAIYNLKLNPPKKEGICDVCGSKLISRSDDNEQTIKNRLATYYKNSKVLIDYYNAKGVLYPICPEDPTAGEASIKVAEKIMEKCKEIGSKKIGNN